MNTEQQLRQYLPPGDLRVASDEQLEAMLDEADPGDKAYDASIHLRRTVSAPAPAWWRHPLLAAVATVALLAGGMALVNALRVERPSVVEQPSPAPDVSEPMIVGTPRDASSKDDAMQVVRLELPQPRYIGTLEKVKRPNLDRRKPRKSFIAPKGTSLVSRGCAVTSSDDEPIIGELEMVTDGDKDGADGSYVELGPEKQWVQLDLGTSREIWAIAIWHFHKSPRAYDDVIVQLSSDPEFKSRVLTVFNNDHDNSLKMGRGKNLAWVETNHGHIVECEGKTARYVRLYSNGNTSNEMNHYTEVEVHGR